MSQYIFITLSLTILFCHGSAKKSDVDTGACVFDKYNNDHELQAVEKIRGLIGKRFTSQSANGEWRFTVGICANLKMENADSEAGAIQIHTIGDDVGKTHNIGSLKDTHLMAGINEYWSPTVTYYGESKVLLVDGHYAKRHKKVLKYLMERDWAVLEYKDGEIYNSHCGQEPKRTVIMLSCDETVDTGDAKMIHVEEESNKQGSCYYLFEMKHKALCPKSSGSVLSVGSVLLITFFSVIALYLLFGFLYQRFILGSKGKEQIPNYEFWKDLGNLEADGCDFVCRSKGRQTTGFRGIGDDQLDATEDIRDDNLLPM